MSGESLAFHERSTKGAVPVPLKASESGVSVALLLNERLPELATLCCGVKVTSTDTFDPAGMVNGNLTSVTANSELLLEGEETAAGFALRLRLKGSIQLHLLPAFQSQRKLGPAH